MRVLTTIATALAFILLPATPALAMEFNPTTQLDTSNVEWHPTGPCTTDTDCVTRFPRTIPDAYTIDDYWRVWGDTPLFPVIGDCTTVDWLAQDENGRPFTPIDLNNDGAINCNSDLELGR